MGFYSRIQRSVFETLEGEVHNPVSKAVEIFIAVLVLLNVLSIILESLHDLHAEYEHWFLYSIHSVWLSSQLNIFCASGRAGQNMKSA